MTPSTFRSPRTVSLCFLILALAALLPATAAAHHDLALYDYYGEHPVPAPIDGWCDEEDFHLHTYLLDQDEYGVYEVDGVHYFVGDAVLHQRRDDSHWYYDPHPLGSVSYTHLTLPTKA